MDYSSIKTKITCIFTKELCLKIINKHISHAGLLLKRAKNNLIYRKESEKGTNISLSPEVIKKYNENRYYGAQKYICLAPFNSMFLSIDGNVYACNLNRKFILGNIKHNSLSEIWNGKKLADLRNYISNKDLSKGCEKCLFNITSGNFDASTSSHYDYVGYNNKTNFPLRMDFEISNICNLGCVMCSPVFSSTIQKEIKGKKLSKNYYNSSILQDIKIFLPHLKFMNFSGGEPFMNNLYFDIWEMLPTLNKSCQVHIQTNGTVLSDKIKSTLQKHRFNIGISIDSLNKETYNTIRLFSDFDKRQEILKYLTEYCHQQKTTLTYSFCLLKKNAFEIPDFVSFANRNNAVLYLSPVFEPVEEAISNLSVMELKSLKTLCLSFHFDSHNDIQTKNIIHFNQFVQQIDIWIDKQEFREQYFKKNTFSSTEIIHSIEQKLTTYFNNYTQINGEPCEDEMRCMEFLKAIINDKDEQKINLLKHLLLENEERIYNQIRYYWL